MYSIYKNPDKNAWPRLCARPPGYTEGTEHTVLQILQSVKSEKDSALYALSRQWDGVELKELVVSPAEMESAARETPPDLAAAMEQAAENIKRYHQAQMTDSKTVETMPGVLSWQKRVAISRVGLYIPGGSAPLFSTVLMLAIPAKLAGCPEIVICTPPQKNGRIPPFCLQQRSAEYNAYLKWVAPRP